jgi:hypothetical protein
MTSKTAWVLALALMVPAVVRAQDPTPPAAPVPAATPPAQAPAAPAQEAPAQEASDADIIGKPKVKVRDFDRWQYNVGVGANLAGGTTHTYVRGGGAVASGGVARNYNKYFGLKAELWWEDLPLRSSALELAQASSASSGSFSLLLGPVINIPVTSKYSGYFVVGPDFYHRYGSLNSPTIPPGSACNGFYKWWTYCPTSIPSGFATTSQNQFGVNLGGGVARKIGQKKELYIDLRYQHSSHNKVTTDVKPITIGIRW